MTNRALVLAAMSAAPVRLRSPLDCGDSDAMIACLSEAGARFERDGDDWIVRSGNPPAGEVELDAAESGTACRLLIAFAASRPGLVARVGGAERLRQRPVGPLVDALRSLGARIEYIGADGFPPVRVAGRTLGGGDAEVESSRSSQFASALLLAAPAMHRGLRLRRTGDAVSTSYLETTREALALFGASSEVEPDGRIAVAPCAVFAEAISIPGDASSALSLACAVAAAGGKMEIQGFSLPCLQADARAFEVLAAMGVTILPGGESVEVRGRASRPVSVRAADFPDAAPVLAAVAARIDGESELSGVSHLSIKESDRAAAIVELLQAIGIPCRAGGGSLHISGARRAGGPAVLPTRADHRMVMAATILALENGGWVEHPAAVAKSYPGFFRALFAGI